ncbi:hypothetical protein NDU88_003319 [Pleurodeles waltl]|uniref:Uncharacterized protein n=1 Tax=Pleurodeles waltl TaxID=8319 RepID=A0AAV7W4E6_PLEWA|nr:hypothetical protein NDU88_003319 [Pleurodeles waltl]
MGSRGLRKLGRSPKLDPYRRLGTAECDRAAPCEGDVLTGRWTVPFWGPAEERVWAVGVARGRRLLTWSGAAVCGDRGSRMLEAQRDPGAPPDPSVPATSAAHTQKFDNILNAVRSIKSTLEPKINALHIDVGHLCEEHKKLND